MTGEADRDPGRGGRQSMTVSDRPITIAGHFLTRVIRTRADGDRLVFLSRRHRKGLPPLRLNRKGARVVLAVSASPWSRLWAPRRLAWWIAVLFIIGSACFAYGAFAANWPRVLLPGMATDSVVGIVFFIGSLFFTTAAGLQLLEAINGDVANVGALGAGHRPDWRWFAWRPRNAGYLASLIQFAGTLLFNFNTGDALFAGLGWVQEDILIWGPDMVGSICFLAASYLALMEISHGWWSFKPRQVAWWVVIINLLGSVAFQVSAFCGFYTPSPEPGWIWDANLWTLIGALCFFVASYLMIPELFDADANTIDGVAPAANVG